MDNSVTIITATLRGIRPIMFDRYPGNNKTKLDPLDKLYLNERGECCIPTTAVYSLLSAQNTNSVPKMFHGKQQKLVATGVLAFCQFEPLSGDDPYMIRLEDEQGNPYKRDDDRIKIYDRFIGKTKQGTPNENSIRPGIDRGWVVRIKITFIDNDLVKLSTLKKMFEQGGVLGLGTFRPVFGRYVVEEWSEN